MFLILSKQVNLNKHKLIKVQQQLQPINIIKHLNSYRLYHAPVFDPIKPLNGVQMYANVYFANNEDKLPSKDINLAAESWSKESEEFKTAWIKKIEKENRKLRILHYEKDKNEIDIDNIDTERNNIIIDRFNRIGVDVLKEASSFYIEDVFQKFFNDNKGMKYNDLKEKIIQSWNDYPIELKDKYIKKFYQMSVKYRDNKSESEYTRILSGKDFTYRSSTTLFVDLERERLGKKYDSKTTSENWKNMPENEKAEYRFILHSSRDKDISNPRSAIELYAKDEKERLTSEDLFNPIDIVTKWRNLKQETKIEYNHKFKFMNEKKTLINGCRIFSLEKKIEIQRDGISWRKLTREERKEYSNIFNGLKLFIYPDQNILEDSEALPHNAIDLFFIETRKNKNKSEHFTPLDYVLAWRKLSQNEKKKYEERFSKLLESCSPKVKSSLTRNVQTGHKFPFTALELFMKEEKEKLNKNFVLKNCYLTWENLSQQEKDKYKEKFKTLYVKPSLTSDSSTTTEENCTYYKIPTQSFLLFLVEQQEKLGEDYNYKDCFEVWKQLPEQEKDEYRERVNAIHKDIDIDKYNPSRPIIRQYTSRKIETTPIKDISDDDIPTTESHPKTLSLKNSSQTTRQIQNKLNSILTEPNENNTIPKNGYQLFIKEDKQDLGDEYLYNNALETWKNMSQVGKNIYIETLNALKIFIEENKKTLGEKYIEKDCLKTWRNMSQEEKDIYQEKQINDTLIENSTNSIPKNGYCLFLQEKNEELGRNYRLKDCINTWKTMSQEEKDVYKEKLDTMKLFIKETKEKLGKKYIEKDCLKTWRNMSQEEKNVYQDKLNGGILVTSNKIPKLARHVFIQETKEKLGDNYVEEDCVATWKKMSQKEKNAYKKKSKIVSNEDNNILKDSFLLFLQEIKQELNDDYVHNECVITWKNMTQEEKNVYKEKLDAMNFFIQETKRELGNKYVSKDWIIAWRDMTQKQKDSYKEKLNATLVEINELPGFGRHIFIQEKKEELGEKFNLKNCLAAWGKMSRKNKNVYKEKLDIAKHSMEKTKKELGENYVEKDDLKI